MVNKITILNNTNQSVIGEIEVEDAYIYEKINDKYTFDFTCYDQPNINLLAQQTLIYADSDYFRIASVVETPVKGLYEVSCEHISYELNNLTPEEEEEEAEDLNYEGKVWEIVPEILGGTRFNWIPSDDIPEPFTFVTRIKGKRSRIIEFCKQNGLEVHWRRFEVAIQKRRGWDKGLVIELGENLRDLRITKSFEVNGTIETSYDIDFIDLNKVLDENGQPLAIDEFHMGDTVNLRYKGNTITQRGLAVGYNPFRRELPTIELGTPSRSIVKVIKDNEKKIDEGKNSGGGGGGEPTEPQVIYGVKIDETNSNPETALTYTDDAVGFTPAYMNFTTDTFNYGSWEDKFPFNQIKPCLFKDGAVVGYLNPNNYAQFEDGSSADITSGASGDVMVEFPKLWWKFERMGNELYVRYASYEVDETFKCLAHSRGATELDNIYIGAYLGSGLGGSVRSLSGKTITTNQTISTFRTQSITSKIFDYYQLMMLQILFIIMFKNQNSQSCLGFGRGGSLATSGNTNSKGLFYGARDGSYQTKFCGVEDTYGNLRCLIDGVKINGAYELLTCNDGFDDINMYENQGKILTSSTSGMLSLVQGDTHAGFIVKQASGSTTTYYCDNVNCYSQAILYFGGYFSDDLASGMFSLNFAASETSKNSFMTSRIAFYGGIE